MAKKTGRSAKTSAKPAAKSNTSDTLTRTEQTTADNKTRLLRALAKHHGLVYKSCKAADVAPSTYYAYLKEDPTFKEEVDRLVGLEVDEIESGLMTLMKSQDERIQLGARKLYLDAKGKDRGYGTERRQQEHSGKIEVESTGRVEIIARIPDNGRDRLTST